MPTFIHKCWGNPNRKHLSYPLNVSGTLYQFYQHTTYPTVGRKHTAICTGFGRTENKLQRYNGIVLESRNPDPDKQKSFHLAKNSLHQTLLKCTLQITATVKMHEAGFVITAPLRKDSDFNCDRQKPSTTRCEKYLPLSWNLSSTDSSECFHIRSPVQPWLTGH